MRFVENLLKDTHLLCTDDFRVGIVLDFSEKESITMPPEKSTPLLRSLPPLPALQKSRLVNPGVLPAVQDGLKEKFILVKEIYVISTKKKGMNMRLLMRLRKVFPSASITPTLPWAERRHHNETDAERKIKILVGCNKIFKPDIADKTIRVSFFGTDKDDRGAVLVSFYENYRDAVVFVEEDREGYLPSFGARVNVNEDGSQQRRYHYLCGRWHFVRV